ncbi:UDP-N-acetylmuramate--L-alanine ligase [Desulfotomaculum copahuensis]|uniref:UDP-N-acetylmuramate--L-alanine ligase n=1 Tax=Desulfotomaculum copahuensis TaxID=1838280 RepID=A0A1B7LEX7_9FIRM|nr:UDP-N-acetylmuramate--L-alanine ligase [Desulfotomaculum copahuensis]OAT81808.1 UDP-N-acetylmuramate--L-alanine ligase [Desulfotomaculum copahuensis]
MQAIPEQVHFVGIGGTGMSGLAKILLELGHRVSGSDLNATEITRRLETMGAICYVGHAAGNINGARMLVVSTAIKNGNPELEAAQVKHLPVIHRSDLLAWLMHRQKGIAVAGAHGKTTTTSMLSLVLEKNGLDPTIVIGGELNDIGGNAKLGRGEYLVAEADESDGSFLKLSPLAVIVTNVEDDHLDHYGSVEQIKKAFRQFLDKVPPGGLAVVCLDDPGVQKVVAGFSGPLCTYGLAAANADYTLGEMIFEGHHSSGEVFYRGRSLGRLALQVPGRHNLLNALAVVAMSRWLGLEFSQITGALKDFRGAGRRFQLLGEARGIQVYDDYAHHPSEIKATLAAARLMHPGRLVAVFQPHRYTRTALLKERFGDAFSQADLVIVNEIYSAGETPIEGVSAQLIIDAIERHDGRRVVYFPTRREIVDYLAENMQPGDLVLTMGAGNIWTVGTDLVRRLREKTV